MISDQHVKMEIRGTTCHLQGDVPVQLLMELLALPRFGRKSYGVPSLFDLASDSFPAGLVDEVLDLFRARGITCELIEESGEAPPVRSQPLKGIELHPFQEEAVGLALKRNAALIQLPCGSGKTMVALAWIGRLGLPALVLMHRAPLVHQFAGFVEAHLGVRAGLFVGGTREPGTVTVGCLPSVRGFEGGLNSYRSTSGIEGFPLIVVDEAHHAAAPANFKTLCALKCTRRLGLSGTPTRRDPAENRILRAFFGPPIEVRAPSELASEGYCARIRVEITPFGGRPLPISGSWSELLDGFVTHKQRNLAIAQIVAELLEKGTGTLVLVANRRHGRILKDLLESRGIGAPFLSARDPVSRRREALERFRRGEEGLLLCSEWITEGTDLPDLGALVLATGQYSRPVTLQRVGRVLRRGSGRKGGVGRVIDFDDRILHPLLGAHLKKRVRVYREQLEAEVVFEKEQEGGRE